jgi:hypothetical protein
MQDFTDEEIIANLRTLVQNLKDEVQQLNMEMAADPKPTWISIKDLVPPEYEQVLLYNGGNVVVGFRAGSGLYYRDQVRECSWIRTVIHWLPLSALNIPTL